jgi:hypothetical protein
MMSNDLQWKNIGMLRLLMEQKVEKAIAKHARKTRDKSQPGRIRLALCDRLRAAGIRIPNAECLWSQQGAYRGKHWDLARWGADFRDESGCHWTLACWCTMTDCVRYGVTWHRDEAGYCEVGSNRPAKK